MLLTNYMDNYYFYSLRNVRRMRLELTHRNRHYPLKVACLPISPSARMVPRTGLEPARSQNHSHLKRARLPIPPPGQSIRERAEDGTRTRDPNLGKVMLYQLSYFRDNGCKDRSIFFFSKTGRYFFYTIFSLLTRSNFYLILTQQLSSRKKIRYGKRVH